eukprot:Partr_v1_DN27567_c0_g1_i3_m30453 putative Striatin, calmodulin binding protein
MEDPPHTQEVDNSQLEGSAAVEDASNGGGPVPLSFPNALHFLHQEWRRFESDRNAWELESAEMRTRLAVLEGEKRGFEVLKSDLLRRIKMLEFALRQERAKGSNASPAAATSTTINASSSAVDESNVAKPVESPMNAYSSLTLGGASNTRNSTINKFKTGTSRTREILRQYLQEVGYSDGAGGDDFGASLTAAASSPSRPSFAAATGSLRGVDGSGGSKSSTFGGRPTSEIMSSSASASWQNERASTIGGGRPAVGTQAMKQLFIPPDRETASNTVKRSSVDSKSRRQKVTESVIYAPEDVEKLNAQNWSQQKRDESPTKSSAGNDAWGTIFAGTDSGDHELADLKLSDDTESETSDSVSKKGSRPVTAEKSFWTTKFTLKSHMDVVTSLAFHSTDLCLLTASEDGCIKYWNLETPAAMKKPPADLEPIHVFRGHNGAVTSVIFSTMIPPSLDSSYQERLQFGTAYSAGVDGSIFMWGVPPKNLTPYSKYVTNDIVNFEAHSDAIWDLKMHSVRPILGSAGADGFINLWNVNALDDAYFSDPSRKKLLKLAIQYDNGSSSICPTSFDFVHTDATKLVASYANSIIKAFDIETGKAVQTYEGSDQTYDKTVGTQINRIIAHPTSPLVISAHEDRCIRFYDSRSGSCIHNMVAHLDSVSSLDISPNGLVLASGGHDG